MAIQNRRGTYSDFDPQKLVAGEWAVVQSGDPNSSRGKAVYMAFNTGDVERMATYEDMAENIQNATADIHAELTDVLDRATDVLDDMEETTAEVEAVKAEVEAIIAAGSGVTTFNTRAGQVVPVAGDYTASMITRGSNSNVNDDLTAIETAISSARDLSSDTVTFTSSDSSSPTAWQTMSTLASGTLSALFVILSKAVANVRFVYSKLSDLITLVGNTTLPTTATTVTGAVAEHETDITGINTLLGSETMGTTATTVTGAIAEHETDITQINSRSRETNWALRANSYELTLYGVSGYVTSSATYLFITIPVYVANSVTTISVSKLLLSLRIPSGGYIVSDGYNATSNIVTNGVILGKNQPIIRISLNRSSGWGVTNNTPVTGEVTMTFTLS